MNRAFKYYEILNTIKPNYLQDNEPYTVLNDKNISLTYRDIYLKYIKGHHFLVNIEKKIKGGSDMPILIFTF